MTGGVYFSVSAMALALTQGETMRLYYHQTDGGAEYLTDTFVICPNGHKEGTFTGASIIVRIDGNIEQDAECTLRLENLTATAP